MNFLQLILFLSFILLINSQWYIKKTYHTKVMNYPNPGKRSLNTEQIDFNENNCLQSFPSFNSFKEKIAWIYNCIYTKALEKTNENSLSSNPNTIKAEANFTPLYDQHTNSYFTEYNKKLIRLLQRKLNNK